MLDLTLFFHPTDRHEYEDYMLGSKITFFPQNTSAFEPGSLCIFSTGDEINGSFRDSFYTLSTPDNLNVHIYDLGHLPFGATEKDTEFALQTVVAELIKKSCIPVLTGTEMKALLSVAMGFEITEQLINICAVDEHINLVNPLEDMEHLDYLSSLLLRRPCFLFNHSTLGVQPNRNDPAVIGLYEKLFFDVCRVGSINADYKITEPIVRNADIMAINLSSLKASERQLCGENPNGLTTEQLCQIAKYSGLSDKLGFLGIFKGQNAPGNDPQIIAHVLWYFLEGVINRMGDFPVGSKKDYLRFNVVLENDQQSLVFYKSNKSDRWWMEVPYPPSENSKFERHHLVPCDQHDYENAMNNELPDLWWRTYQKLG